MSGNILIKFTCGQIYWHHTLPYFLKYYYIIKVILNDIYSFSYINQDLKKFLLYRCKNIRIFMLCVASSRQTGYILHSPLRPQCEWKCYLKWKSNVCIVVCLNIDMVCFLAIDHNIIFFWSPGFARFGRLVPQWDVDSVEISESAGGFLVEFNTINCASGTPLLSVDNIQVSDASYFLCVCVNFSRYTIPQLWFDETKVYK